MSAIVAGGFELLTQAEAAIARLTDAGIVPEFICKYRVNPAGQHNALPAGGDRDESPGAHHAHGGAAKGAAIGAVVGLAAGAVAAPLFGPLGVAAGVGVGAYTGSLMGSLNRIDGEAQPGHSEVRPAETLVAVNIDGAGWPEDDVIRIFEECGATQVERAEGRWSDGEWADFDPLSAPRVIGGRDRGERRPTAGA